MILYLCVYDCIYISMYTYNILMKLSVFPRPGRGPEGSQASVTGQPQLEWLIGIPGSLHPLHGMGQAARGWRRAAPADGATQGSFQALAVPTPWPRRDVPGGFSGQQARPWTLQDTRRRSSRPPAARGTAGSISGSEIVLPGLLLGPFVILFCFLFIRLFFPSSAPFTDHGIPGASPFSLSSHGFVFELSRPSPMTCPPCALHRGSCPPHLAKPHRGTEGSDGAGHGCMGTPGASHKEQGERFGLGGPPKGGGAGDLDPAAFAATAAVISAYPSSGRKQGGKWVRAGGVAQRPLHWLPWVNRSLPSSASSGWRI